tara:strand:- start:49 stop:717 length:669 start_codon:yes stop_codon:yes gene_type:complete
MYRGIMKKEIYDLIGYKDNPEEFDKWWDNLTDEKLDDYFKFAFVRNPYDRLVSAFNHIIMEETLTKLYKYWPIIKPNDVLQPTNIEFYQLFMLFSLFTKRGLQSYNINDDSVHWMPQNNHVEMDGYQIVDFVGKYENLEVDWKYVANKIGVSEELPFLGASNTSKESSKTREEQQNLHWSDFYMDLDTIKDVSKFYRRDIDIFQYNDCETHLLRKQEELIRT